MKPNTTTSEMYRSLSESDRKALHERAMRLIKSKEDCWLGNSTHVRFKGYKYAIRTVFAEADGLQIVSGRAGTCGIKGCCNPEHAVQVERVQGSKPSFGIGFKRDSVAAQRQLTPIQSLLRRAWV